jgi:hypothetical protein
MIGTFALVLFFTMIKEAYEVCVVIIILMKLLDRISQDTNKTEKSTTKSH